MLSVILSVGGWVLWLGERVGVGVGVGVGVVHTCRMPRRWREGC
jgi:hypothetical protein